MLVYKPIMTGNTQQSIYDCLYFLYRRRPQSRSSDYRVSLAYRKNGTLFYVGDDLEIADPRTGKTVKKRWWERGDPSQLRLPFSLYQLATVVSLIRINQDCEEDTFQLEIQHAGGHISTGYRYGLCGPGVKAIRVYQATERPNPEETQPSNPFSEQPMPSGLFIQPVQSSTEPSCRIAVAQAVSAGLV